MTRRELRKLCDSLNPGGQTKLAGMLGWAARTMRNKLAGKTKITQSDELAVERAMQKLSEL
jgi:hypothetical protein